MLKPLHHFLTFLLVLGALASQAQTQTLEGFSNFSKKGLTPIYDGKEVKGYTMFYKADKADKKNDNYGLDFYDQNLQKVKSVVVPKERYNTRLMRSAYNGKAFGFYFLNIRKKTLELEVYDRALNKVGSREFTKLSRADLNVLAQEMQLPGTGENRAISGLNLYAIPNKGFIRNGFSGMLSGFTLEMYDNNLELKWTYQTDEKSKDYESLLVNEVTDNYLLATIARRPNAMSKKLTFYTAVFDLATGKKVLDLPVEKNPAEQLSMSSFSFDEKKNEFLIQGEFYKPEDKPLINKSQGFFVKRLDLSGKETLVKFYSWDKDVMPLLSEAGKKSREDGFLNYVHRIVRGADGKQHMVVEQFKLKADGASIAMGVFAQSSSVLKGLIGNFMIFTLDQDSNLEKIAFFEKDHAETLLPAGSGFFGAGLIGMIIDMTGGFHYQFTQEENGQQQFSTAYINYKDVKKSKFDEKTLVNIRYAGNADFKTDKLDVSSNKDIKSFVYPAKPGYVLVLNSQPEGSKLDMKLVKLNN